MARLRLGQKVDRVMQFLLGLRHRRVVTPLAAHGFSQEELDEGWQNVRAAVGETLNVGPVTRPEPGLVERLDAWENKWFPIAGATLSRHFSEIHDEVFLNLSQTEGPQVAISVGTFLERIDALADAGGDRTKARKLLEKRGLDAATMAEARALLTKIGTVETGPPADIEAEKAEREKAEAAMWGWYLEWSRIARTAIDDGQLLRLLGFGRSSSRSAAADDSADEDEETSEAPTP